jgi:hypothetical protein
MLLELEDLKKQLKEEELFYSEIGHSIWLMNDHKWAFLGWEKSCKRRPAILAHLDWHWDGINDFRNPQDYDHLRNIKSHEELKELIAENRLIRRDSFIAPAIIKGITDEVHFFCLQNNTESGLDDELLQSYGVDEIRHTSIEDLVRVLRNGQKPLIMDLDLDLFNRDTPFYAEGAELSRKIIEFLDKCGSLFERAEVVTIAKSPGAWWIRNQNRWDWDRDLSEDVAKIALPHIVSIRSH